MATAQMQRSIVSSVSLPTHVATEQQSMFLIKRLLAVSVSCITYLRGLFPEYAYGTRYLEDICVKILREDKSCPGSTQLVKWMLGCYDALQRRYLRMVVLAIYTNPEDPQTFTECYQFKFKYTAHGPVMDFTNNKGTSTISASSDVKKASILLIRKLYILMQNLGPLPSDVCLTMKLFYYDEVTPADYQPPGFKEGSCRDMMFEGEPMYLNVGEVATPFHVLKVKVTTEKDRIENIENNHMMEEETRSPAQSLKLDLDCVEKPEHPVKDVPAAGTNLEKNDDGLVNVEELSLTGQENKNLKPDGNENTQHLQTQVEESQQRHPSPLSTARTTRSGRIIPYASVDSGTKRSNTTSKESRKTGQMAKQTRPFEIPLSQDEPSGPKRRKFSEPKDLY